MYVQFAFYAQVKNICYFVDKKQNDRKTEFKVTSVQR